jgi:protein arginine kinase activator
MKCDSCGENEAIILVHQTIGTETVELHLCEVCAEKRGISAQDGKIEFSVASLLNGLFDQKAESKAPIGPCPDCGLRIDELDKSGRLGCATCATVFQDEIFSLMKKYSRGNQHRGKYPKEFLSGPALNSGRENLRELLKKALESEDYERAAELRDKLKSFDSMKEGEADGQA